MISTPISRRKFAQYLLAAGAGAGILSGSRAFAQVRAKIMISGASTLAPLVQEIAHRFEERNPGILVDVQSGGTSRGIADTRRQIADIGMVSRALTEAEGDLLPITLGRDGIAMIVHKSNPIADLSDDMVRRIYRGEVTRWEEIGSFSGTIAVVNKAEGRSTLDIFVDYLGLGVKDIKAQVVIGDNEQAVKVVAGNPRAIGYISIGTAEYHVQAGTPLRMIALGPVAATAENVANGSYAAVRPLNLVTATAAPQPHVAAFISFAASEQNHDLVRENFFVPPAK